MTVGCVSSRGVLSSGSESSVYICTESFTVFTIVSKKQYIYNNSVSPKMSGIGYRGGGERERESTRWGGVEFMEGQ